MGIPLPPVFLFFYFQKKWTWQEESSDLESIFTRESDNKTESNEVDDFVQVFVVLYTHILSVLRAHRGLFGFPSKK